MLISSALHFSYSFSPQQENHFAVFYPCSMNVSLPFSSLASGSMDKTLMIWNLASKARAFRLVGHQDIITGVHFSPSGNLVATSSKDRTVRLWKPSMWASLHGLVESYASRWTYIEGGCGARWRALLPTCLWCCDMCVCVVEKQTRRSSKLTPLLCEVLLSPTMARNWWRPLMTSPSKCGASPATPLFTLSTSTPTGCAVPGSGSRFTLWNTRGDGW